jgi:hypothetical protein
MKFKEIRIRTGELVSYSDENGAVHSLSSIYKKDGDGKPTTELLDGVEIIPMTGAEVQEVKQRAEALETQGAATQYQSDRAKEYPDFRDYLDGIVKGDQAQIDAYIAACQAVKAKYPKP